MNKRHAKPTTMQLVARIYRKQIAMEIRLTKMYEYFGLMDYHLGINERTLRDNFKALRSGQAMLSQRMESFRILADHCTRLLKEKETLNNSNASVSHPLDTFVYPVPQNHNDFKGLPGDTMIFHYDDFPQSTTQTECETIDPSKVTPTSGF